MGNHFMVEIPDTGVEYDTVIISDTNGNEIDRFEVGIGENVTDVALKHGWIIAFEPLQGGYVRAERA